MKILFTFPGQGTQRPNMLQHLPERDAVLSEVRAVLGQETDTLDTAISLQHTRAVQLCLLIAGVAWARALIRKGITPDMVSGLSIGAYPAAVIAGALRFSDALRLVARRGDLMEQAYPQGYGLTVIIGLTADRLEALMAGSGTFIANLNAETQTVIAGRDEDMAVVARKALNAGASKVARLDVSVPSHCALLNKPAEALNNALSAVTFSSPVCEYLSSTTARVLRDPQRIADDLAFNMARTVRWYDTVIAANERDARLAIEMPPGSVLTGLTYQAGWQGDAICLERNTPEVAAHLAARIKR